MKTILQALLLLCVINVTNAQIVNIPDPNFKQALLDHDPIIDTNGDGEIQVIEAEIVTELIVGDPWVNFGIQDLTGIEAFVNLTFLNCENNQLTTLTLNQNVLLETLICYDNLLTSIDVSQNNQLKSLGVNNNQLTSIDLSQNVQLTSFSCGGNQLTSLLLENNTQLISLGCNDNQLTTLELSQNTLLQLLSCQNNQLTYLDIRNGNNVNITAFTSYGNPNLTCIFVDDAAYSQANWPFIDPASTFVETQEECDALGFNDFFIQEIKIYPNPVQNRLNVQLPEHSYQDLSFKIVDILGKEVYSAAHTDLNFHIDISTLQQGIYFLSIYNHKTRLLTKKLIKS